MTAQPSDASPGASANAKRILFVYYRDLSTFIERDWKIISGAYPNSELFCFRGVRDLLRLRAEERKADLCFCWFGSRHALAAACLKPKRMPLVIVAGGYDVARVPEIGYGTFAHPLRGAVARRMFRRADRVLAVSAFTAHAAEVHAGVPRERLRVIYHGFDASAWSAAPGPRTVDAAMIASGDTVRKGLDLVFGAAAIHVDRRFELIGAISSRALARVGLPRPDNVDLTGPLYGRDLKQRLARAKVYLQPSRHESFGCAVAEAMLLGCIPVVARTSALPEVVGDAGFYTEELTAPSLACALEAAWAAPEEARAVARARIAGEFPLDRYAARLVDNLCELLT